MSLSIPTFLLRRYAVALRRARYEARIILGPKRDRAASYVALHFGNSYLIAKELSVSKNLKR